MLKHGTMKKPSVCQKILWCFPSFWNVFTLFLKNILILRRNIGVLIFELILPSFQMILFCACVGGKVHDIGIAVVNNETSGPASSMYLQELDTKMITQVNYSHRFNDAMRAAKDGEVWGIIDIGANYTWDLWKRMNMADISNQSLAGGTIHLYLDMSDAEISTSLKAEIIRAYQAFLRAVVAKYDLKKGLAADPIKLEKPIFGEMDLSFMNYMAPGLMCSIPFFMAMGLTALTFVLERKEGLLERSLCSGVSMVEVMLRHFASQFLVLIVQVILIIVFSLAVFKIPCEGSVVIAVIMILLNGTAGMALGLLISAVSIEERTAVQLCVGSMYPNLILSGIIWPLQAMPRWLHYISYCLPMTFPAEALRSVLLRGLPPSDQRVWLGFVVSIGYFVVFLLLSGIIMRIRK